MLRQRFVALAVSVPTSAPTAVTPAISLVRVAEFTDSAGSCFYLVDGSASNTHHRDFINTTPTGNDFFTAFGVHVLRFAADVGFICLHRP